MPRKTTSLFGFWAATLEAQAAMWVTLGVRLPQLMSGTMSPAEHTRMVDEKMDAFAESAQAASLSLGRMLLHPAQTPVAMVEAMTALSAAASRPFHQRVNANAKRLGSRRVRTSG